MLEGGDHWIVIGRIIAVHQGEEPIDPLIFYRGHYRELASISEIDEKDIEDSAFWAFPW
jgi:flavin reductase (DIM6/NTAB) family NADH-FMN oxidoreductase RutF